VRTISLAHGATGSTNHLPLRAGAQRPSCDFVDNPAFQAKPDPPGPSTETRSPRRLSPPNGVERPFVEPRRFDRLFVHEDTRSHTKGAAARPPFYGERD